MSNRPRLRDIISAACIVVGVEEKYILAPIRQGRYMRARHLISYVAVKNGYAVLTVANTLGRDHSCVRCSIERITAEIADGNQQTIDSINYIERRAGRLTDKFFGEMRSIAPSIGMGRARA